MTTTYTSAFWIVKPGQEEAFAAAWEDFARWASEHEGAGTLCLVRDREDASRYLSFAPWRDLEAVQAWKAGPEFRERIGKVKQHVDEFSPMELELVTEVAPAQSAV
jgi:heme-degrading monooxygenase HmoA